MPGHCCANSKDDVSGRLSGTISRSIEKIKAMSEEIGEALERIRACPGPCEDGTVPVILSSGRFRQIPCPLLNRKCAYGVRMENAFNRCILKIMLEAGVPLRHIDNFGALRETAALKIVREWGMRGFLVLTGPPGTGKSFAAACAVRKFLESRILPDRLDRAARKSAETVRALKSVMWYGADEIAGDKTAASRARDRPLVVIDDLGGEGGTFERQNAIRSIISKRYDSKLSTVVTTGLTMPDIRDRYGRYIAERLIEDVRHGGKVVVCGEVSVRLNAMPN